MKTVKRKRLFGRPSFVAAAIISGLIIVAATLTIPGGTTKAMAAERLFESAINGAAGLKNMKMLLNLRANPNENFSTINLDAEMIPVSITLSREPSLTWRIEKGERTVVFDNNKCYMWLDNSNYISTSRDFDYIENFALLLEPENLLSEERSQIDKWRDNFTLKNKKNETILVINAVPRGDFSESTYSLNKSISESNNRREYVFDRKSNLLKSIKIYIIADGEEKLVLETMRIDYDTPVDVAKITALPSGREITDSDREPESDIFSKVDAREAVRLVFTALSEGRGEEIADALFYYDENIEELEKTYNNVKIKNIGAVFHSGNYAGIYVPISLLMPDGTTDTYNIAMRNDNPNKVWLVDGGI